MFVRISRLTICVCDCILSCSAKLDTGTFHSVVDSAPAVSSTGLGFYLST